MGLLFPSPVSFGGLSLFLGTLLRLIRASVTSEPSLTQGGLKVVLSEGFELLAVPPTGILFSGVGYLKMFICC